MWQIIPFVLLLISLYCWPGSWLFKRMLEIVNTTRNRSRVVQWITVWMLDAVCVTVGVMHMQNIKITSFVESLLSY